MKGKEKKISHTNSEGNSQYECPFPFQQVLCIWGLTFATSITTYVNRQMPFMSFADKGPVIYNSG